MDTNALYKLTYGLYVLTAKQGDKDNGCIIDAAMQVAAGPDRIGIAVNKEHYTHDMIQATGTFNLSVLTKGADFDLFRRFGFQSGKTCDKFADFQGMKRSDNGLYYITEGTNAYFSVQVEKTVDVGSHTLFIGTITWMEVLSKEESITYGYYRDNIKF